jgi:hypothetical protein
MAVFALRDHWLHRSAANRARMHLTERLKRRRLVRAVERRAEFEHERCHRGGVIEFESLAVRAALYRLIVRRLQDSHTPLPVAGLKELEQLLVESPPFRDYGANAEARNERIAGVLEGLGRAGHDDA